MANICPLVGDPAHYNGRIVAVRARLISDGLEHTVIVDDNCADKGIVLNISSRVAEKDPGVIGLTRAIYNTGMPGTIDKHISATFIGTFQWRQTARHPRMLEISSVRDLHVKFPPTLRVQ